jgi:predicted DNA-binding transcriptional regulator AlpA
MMMTAMPSKSHQLRAQSQPRRGLRREEAAIYLGISASMFDLEVRAGRLPKPIRFGSLPVWDMHQLDSAFDGPGGATNGSPNPWD